MVRWNARRDVLRGTLGLASAAVAARFAHDAPAVQAAPGLTATAVGRKPNILLVLADDLGRHELGCYGQERIRTPVADALAAEGLRFTQAYANPSCAPSRCSLLTGLHTGHATVKRNDQAAAGFAPQDLTVGEVLKRAGYATGIIGKWGFGSNTRVDDSHPQFRGFEHFFGYIGHNAAHDYWPTTLWRDGQRVSYPENQGADVTYATDHFTEDALDFVRSHKHEPFFLFLAYTTPHAPNEVPSDAPYTHRAWPVGERNHAAQVTRLDTELGRVLAELEAQDIADNTIVVFTSDNGPHAAGRSYQHVGSTLPHDPEFFDSNGDLRGIKFTVYEGGIRVPFIVRVPEALGGVGDRVVKAPVALWDLLPTFAEAAGTTVVRQLDGLSLLPLVTGGAAPERGYFYWADDDTAEAVRFGRWKGVRQAPDRQVELYDLRRDVSERHDLATRRPARARQARRLMRRAVA